MGLDHDEVRAVNDLVLLGCLVVELHGSVVSGLVGDDSCLINDDSFLLFIVKSSVSSLLGSLVA